MLVRQTTQFAGSMNSTHCRKYFSQKQYLHISDGRVITSSAVGAVDLGLIPSSIKPMTSKLLFTASLLDTLITRQCGEQAGKVT